MATELQGAKRICGWIRGAVLLSLIYFTIFSWGCQAMEMKIRPARELLEIARATSSQVLPFQTARSLPLATRSGSTVKVVILYYKESVIPKKEIVYPPHHIMVLDSVSGEIVRFESCSPKDLGVNKPAGVPEEGYGLDPEMSADDFWEKVDRFLDLSRTVWEVFALGTTTVDWKTAIVLREYYSLFRQIAKKPLMPYYQAVAKDFLDWLNRMSK